MLPVLLHYECSCCNAAGCKPELQPELTLPAGQQLLHLAWTLDSWKQGVPQHMVYPGKWCDSQENLHMVFQGSGSLHTQYTSSHGTSDQTAPFGTNVWPPCISSQDTMDGVHSRSAKQPSRRSPRNFKLLVRSP